MIITRKIINKDIRYHDYKNKQLVSYDYLYLSRLIDAYKNLFIKKGVKKDSTIVIGNHANIEQIALVFACAELGISIVIIANPFPPNKGAKDYVKGLINPKLRLLMPINLFVLCNRDDTDKFQIFSDVCRFTIVINEEELDYTPNDVIRADENTIFLKCTSSGTTGDPKVITHKHGFMYDLIYRNSKRFYGSMAMITNLAHGSSPAVYFLPGMISNTVTDYYNLPNLHPKEVADVVVNHDFKLDHILVPYTVHIDEFFDSDKSIQGCTIHTLGLIRKSWVEKVNIGTVADIISIFGTNETSGPFMINQATDIDFSENTYKLVDDFYSVGIDENHCLQVTLPFYDITVNTLDTILRRGDKFVHIGRSNFYRINDLELDVGKYQIEIDKIMKAELVVDTNKDNIYLAIWDVESSDDKVKQISDMMRKDSNGLHFISKYANLEYHNFLNGIKLDKEMLREYFRDQ